MRADEDPYKTLGLAPDATIEQIKHAYREAVMRWHPDVSGASPAESERRFRQVTDAYKRALRNARLGAGSGRTPRKTAETSGAPGPHGDHRYYTPPVPPPRRGRAEPHPLRPGARLGRKLRVHWRGARTGLYNWFRESFREKGWFGKCSWFDRVRLILLAGMVTAVAIVWAIAYISGIL